MANVSDMNNIVKQLEKSTFPAAVKRSAYSRNSTRNNGNESDHNKNDSDSDSNDDDNTNGDGDTGTKERTVLVMEKRVLSEDGET